MAGAKSGVHLCQLKMPQVHPDLVMGSKFVKIDEDNLPAPTCYIVLLKVDPKGYIAYWKDVSSQHDPDFIDLYMLRDVRTGKQARLPKDSKIGDVSSNFGDSVCPVEDKTVTFCWGNDFVNLQWASFVAKTAEIAQLWCQELFSYAYNVLSVNSSVGVFYERAWTKLFYTQHDGKVSLKNVLKLFALHKEDKERVLRCLRESGITVSQSNEYIATDQLLLPRFIDFCCSISFKQDAQQLFEDIASSSDNGNSKSSLTIQQVISFLNDNQRDPRLNELLYPYWNESRVRPLIERFEADEKLKEKDRFSVEAFIQLLVSEDNNAAPVDELDLSHEMNHPLSHYYIASSHNTYLTGHQLTGKSSVEMYRQVLLSGCRCVELDCWDGRTPDEEPIIKHGFTMVTEIPLKEALDAINECAFRTSPFPVILSLENHCSPKQQTKIATHLKNVFGTTLLTDALPSHPLEPGVPLPPPTALLNKVLIKNKKVSAQHLNDKTNAYRLRADSNSSAYRIPRLTESSFVSESPPLSAKVNEEQSQVVASTLPSANHPDSEIEGDSGDETFSQQSQSGVVGNTATSSVTTINIITSSNSSNNLNEQDPRKSSQKIPARRASKNPSSYVAVKDLSDLVNYIQPVHFISFENAGARNHSFETSSISEATCFNLLKLYPVEFVNYNKRQLSRVYPRGTRVDSHNYLPFLFWVAGCQMVALNYQILDMGMQLYMGCFEFNHRCGYLLKPPCMVQKTANFSPFLESATDHSVVAATVQVKIISGQFLSPRRISTYCEVEMFGLPSDTIRKKFRTKIVPNNGLNPAYNSDNFVFYKVVLPRLAILRFVVCDDTGRFVGHRIFPVDKIKPGYRFICLRSESNQPIPSASLFVHIKVHDFLADKHRELADALANPIAYMSKLDARAKQLEVLDVDETSEQSISEPSETPVAAAAPAPSVQSNNQTNTNSPKMSVNFSITSGPTEVLSPLVATPSIRISDDRAPSASGVSRNSRLSSTGLDRIRKLRADELPPVEEINATPNIAKLIKKRNQLLNMMQRKCTKVDFGDGSDVAKKEKVATMWRKSYAEQRGVAAKYCDLLAATSLQALSSSYNERNKMISQLFRSEERELRRLLSRERSFKLKEVSSSTALVAMAANGSDLSTTSKEELGRRKRQLQQELIDRAVDEISTMKEASQTMDQRLKSCLEDRQSEIEEWRRKMESEIEEQYALVLSELENAVATDALASLHRNERTKNLRSESGSLTISSTSAKSSPRHIAVQLSSIRNDPAESIAATQSQLRDKSYSGLLDMLPAIDEPLSAGQEESSFVADPISDSPKTSLAPEPISLQYNSDVQLERRMQRSRSARQSLRRLLSCFR